MAELEKRWYVLKVISGHESRVKEYIELDMKNHHYEKLVPQVLVPTRKVEVEHLGLIFENRAKLTSQCKKVRFVVQNLSYKT